jgi:hypothetical protein
MQAVLSVYSKFPSKLLARQWLGKYMGIDGIFYNPGNELPIHVS